MFASCLTIISIGQLMLRQGAVPTLTQHAHYHVVVYMILIDVIPVLYFGHVNSALDC